MPYKDLEKKREANRRYRARNPEKARESSARWREQNPEKNQASKKRWASENRTKQREASRRWRRANAEKHKEASARWMRENPDAVKASRFRCRARIRKARREYNRIQRRENPNFRIARNLRCRLYQAVKGGRKTGSAVQDLGCTIDEFKSYISSLFKPGMSWDNWGKVWHLDHIKPLSAFDLTEREQLLQACHFTNMQPLFVEENLQKGAAY